MILYIVLLVIALASSPWVILWYFRRDDHAPDDKYNRPFDDGGEF